MDQEFKAKWIEALRSGKYTQGRSALRNSSNSFCCLGVACDVIDPNAWDDSIGHDFFWASKTGDEKPRSAYIPDVTAKKIGLESEAMVSLASMNDTQRMSFAQIADWVEGNL